MSINQTIIESLEFRELKIISAFYRNFESQFRQNALVIVTSYWYALPSVSPDIIFIFLVKKTDKKATKKANLDANTRMPIDHTTSSSIPSHAPNKSLIQST